MMTLEIPDYTCPMILHEIQNDDSKLSKGHAYCDLGNIFKVVCNMPTSNDFPGLKSN